MKDLSKIEIINDYFLNYAEVIYFKTDHYGHIIECNNFAEKIFNRELVKKNIRDIINFPDKNINFNYLAEKDETITLSCKIYNDVYETFILKFYKINENFIIFSCSDSKEIISDKIQIIKYKKEILTLNKYIQNANLELKKLNDLKNKCYFLTAQDINNHLFAVQTYTDMLLNELEDRIDHNEKKFFNSIKTDISELKNLSADLINSYDMFIESLNLEYKIYDIKKFTTEALLLCESIAANYNIKLIINTDENIDTINADIYKLMLVLTDITINAIQYSKPDSEIIIDIVKKENEILFSVKDSGSGIPDKNKEKIFKPFSEKNNKTGFGLAISKKIIESHKGKIWFESEIDKGSTFYFTIPCPEEIKE